VKKTLTLSISLVLFLSVFSPHALASVKSGTKCPAQGQTKNWQGKKYTCTKSGKKLVWNKGVPLTKPAADPVISPTLSPSTTQPEVQKPAQTPVGLWQKTQFEILEQLKKLKPAKIQQLTFVLSPNADKDLAKTLQESYQEPITYLSNLYVNPSKVTFLVMNENDKEWWLGKLVELKSTQPTDWWDGNTCRLSPKVHCGYGSTPNPDGTFHFGHILGSEILWKDMDYTIAHHESIHVYQLGLMGDRMQALPYWFAEGQANYLGYTFSHRFVDSRIQRLIQINAIKNYFGNLQSYSDQQWYEWLQKIDSDSEYTFSLKLGYSVGELILESLYNEHGFRKVHDWMVAIKNGSDYKTGFKSVFGQDYDSWLRDTAAPYLNSQI
jgi:hypothetical protein